MPHLLPPATRRLLLVLCLLPSDCLVTARRRESSSSWSSSCSSTTTLGRWDLTMDEFPLFRRYSTTASAATSNPRRIRSLTRPTAVSWNLHSYDQPREEDPHQHQDGIGLAIGNRSLEPTRTSNVHPAVVLKRRPLKKEDYAKLSTANHELALRLSQPLIPQETWDRMISSVEPQEVSWFQYEDAVESLTKSGLRLCATPKTTSTSDDTQDPLVNWAPHPTTTQVLEDYRQDKEAALKDGNVLVYVGTILKDNVVGSGLPMIKTESILPLAAQDMALLLMDSTKVPIYNKMSLGRTDVQILHSPATTTTSSGTKIVRNLTQPPLAKSSMVSVTLMHSRPLRDDDPLSTKSLSSSSSPSLTSNQGHVVVSRAVPGMVGQDFEDLPRNDILMGVNVLQDRIVDQQSNGECFMTAVTHVYSPMLPKLLAKSMGVTSAVNFVRDIRDSCHP